MKATARKRSHPTRPPHPRRPLRANPRTLARTHYPARRLARPGPPPDTRRPSPPAVRLSSCRRSARLCGLLPRGRLPVSPEADAAAIPPGLPPPGHSPVGPGLSPVCRLRSVVVPRGCAVCCHADACRSARGLSPSRSGLVYCRPDGGWSARGLPPGLSSLREVMRSAARTFAGPPAVGRRRDPARTLAGRPGVCRRLALSAGPLAPGRSRLCRRSARGLPPVWRRRDPARSAGARAVAGRPGGCRPAC